MTILKQRDPLWGSVHLGLSKLTIHDYGCTTCCLAMMNNYFGANCTPDQVAAHNEWYTPDGLLLWNKIELQRAIFDVRTYGYDKKKISETLKDPNKAVLIEVQIQKGGKHWLLGESVSIFGTLKAYDPWNGDLCDVVKRYGNPTGAAYFNKR